MARFALFFAFTLVLIVVGCKDSTTNSTTTGTNQNPTVQPFTGSSGFRASSLKVDSISATDVSLNGTYFGVYNGAGGIGGASVTGTFDWSSNGQKKTISLTFAINSPAAGQTYTWGLGSAVQVYLNKLDPSTKNIGNGTTGTLTISDATVGTNGITYSSFAGTFNGIITLTTGEKIAIDGKIKI